MDAHRMSKDRVTKAGEVYRGPSKRKVLENVTGNWTAIGEELERLVRSGAAIYRDGGYVEASGAWWC